MKNIYRIFLIGIFFFAALVPAAFSETSAPAVRATIDRHLISIGDRIRYKVEIAGDKDCEIKFPKFADGLMGDFEIKDSGSEIKKGFFGKDSLIHWYDITSYALGNHIIPEFDIHYKRKGAKDWASVKTNPIEITAESVLPKGAVLKDIKGIKGPFGFFEVNWVLVSIIIIIILIVTGGFIFYMKRKAAMPLKLPHETALEEIEAIKGVYVRGGDVKEYYIGISDCIRRYIERSFRLKAPEMTTEEFLNSLRDSSALTLEQKDLLKNFLNACDLVKFAKYAPSRAEAEAVYMTARKFVEETKDVHI